MMEAHVTSLDAMIHGFTIAGAASLLIRGAWGSTTR